MQDYIAYHGVDGVGVSIISFCARNLFVKAFLISFLPVFIKQYIEPASVLFDYGKTLAYTHHGVNEYIHLTI